MFAWYVYCINHYFTFKGRANRAEYWSFTLINMVLLFLFSYAAGASTILDILTESNNSIEVVTVEAPTALEASFMAINFVYSLFILFPQLSVTVRRLHDRDHTGWLVLFTFIPLLNLVLLILLLLPSLPQPNMYGMHAPAHAKDQVPDLFETQAELFKAYEVSKGKSGLNDTFTGPQSKESSNQDNTQNSTSSSNQDNTFPTLEDLNPPVANNQQTNKETLSLWDEMRHEPVDDDHEDNMTQQDTKAQPAKPTPQPSTPTPASATHRPMTPKESSLVNSLKNRSKKA